jgi:hypothetical protein
MLGLGPELTTVDIRFGFLREPRNKHCLGLYGLNGNLSSSSLGCVACRSGSPWRSRRSCGLILGHPVGDDYGSDQFLHCDTFIFCNLPEFRVDLRVKGLHELSRHCSMLPVYRPHAQDIIARF